MTKSDLIYLLILGFCFSSAVRHLAPDASPLKQAYLTLLLISGALAAAYSVRAEK